MEIDTDSIIATSNSIMAMCAVIALFKFGFKRMLKFKSFKIKGLSVSECIQAIHKRREELDDLSGKVLDSLEELKYNDADKYFSKDKDVETFRKFSGSSGKLVIKGDTIVTKEDKYFEFYNGLTATGREELKKLEIGNLNDKKLKV